MQTVIHNRTFGFIHTVSENEYAELIAGKRIEHEIVDGAPVVKIYDAGVWILTAEAA